VVLFLVATTRIATVAVELTAGIGSQASSSKPTTIRDAGLRTTADASQIGGWHRFRCGGIEYTGRIFCGITHDPDTRSTVAGFVA
jgi:hypothetical protein